MPTPSRSSERSISRACASVKPMPFDSSIKLERMHLQKSPLALREFDFLYARDQPDFMRKAVKKFQPPAVFLIQRIIDIFSQVNLHRLGLQPQPARVLAGDVLNVLEAIVSRGFKIRAETVKPHVLMTRPDGEYERQPREFFPLGR